MVSFSYSFLFFLGLFYGRGGDNIGYGGYCEYGHKARMDTVNIGCKYGEFGGYSLYRGYGKNPV